MLKGWRRYYGFLNPVEEFTHIDRFVEKMFVSFAARCIKRGKWRCSLPSGIQFPQLNPENDHFDGSKKMRILWKEAIERSKPIQLKEIKRSVERKVSRRRQKHRREEVHRGDLVVTTPGYFIAKRGERVVVRMKQKIITEVPVVRIKGITLSTRGVALSAEVIELCMKKDIPIHLLDGFGRILAVIRPLILITLLRKLVFAPCI